MRTIKFRGKDSNGKWHYGDLIHSCKGEFVRIHDYETNGWYKWFSDVDPATVGQFTGLTDKSGTPIYEGDIVQWGDSGHKIKQVVEFRNGAFGYVYDTIGSFVPYAANTNFDFAALGTDKRFEVIGNIHDNKSLIKEGGEQ